MPVYTASVVIDAPAETVWRVLSDITQWPAWTPTVTGVIPFDTAELRVGSRFKVTQPKLRPATWTVTIAVVNAGFVWESSTSGMVMIAEHLIKPCVNGQTRVNLSFAFRGMLGAVLGWWSKALVASYLATEADSLRRHVEGLRMQPSGGDRCAVQ